MRLGQSKASNVCSHSGGPNGGPSIRSSPGGDRPCQEEMRGRTAGPHHFRTPRKPCASGLTQNAPSRLSWENATTPTSSCPARRSRTIVLLSQDAEVFPIPTIRDDGRYNEVREDVPMRYIGVALVHPLRSWCRLRQVDESPTRSQCCAPNRVTTTAPCRHPMWTLDGFPSGDIDRLARLRE